MLRLKIPFFSFDRIGQRDQSANSSVGLFQKAGQPRSVDEMPQKLNRPPLEGILESVVAAILLHPAHELLDSLTQDWAMGTLLDSGLESGEEAPTTQHEAAAAIEKRLQVAGL